MATPSTTTGATGGQAPPPFPPFQQEYFPSQLLWFALAFGLLYVLMSRVALPRVATIIEDRRARIAADLAEAQRMQAESVAAAQAHEKALADARARSQSIAGEARDKMMAESEASRKALEAKLNAQLAEAEKTIAGTKESAMSNVREVAIDTAAAIVQRLIGSAPAPASVGQAVDRVLKG
jgi:F-type H+-transporting ATPase subunit b